MIYSGRDNCHETEFIYFKHMCTGGITLVIGQVSQDIILRGLAAAD